MHIIKYALSRLILFYDGFIPKNTSLPSSDRVWIILIPRNVRGKCIVSLPKIHINNLKGIGSLISYAHHEIDEGKPGDYRLHQVGEAVAPLREKGYKENARKIKITYIHYTVVPYSRQNAQTSISFERFCDPSKYAFSHNKLWCPFSPYYCLVQIKIINYYYMPHHQIYIELKSSNEGLKLLCFEFVNYLFNLCCQKYYKSILDNCVCSFLC